MLRAVIKSSLTEGSFIDTEFHVFSSRTASGFVTAPRAVFANSRSLIDASTHFEHLLSGGFSESMNRKLDVACYADERISATMYGYESDSDLEDVEEDEDTLCDQGLEPLKFIQPGTSRALLEGDNSDFVDRAIKRRSMKDSEDSTDTNVKGFLEVPSSIDHKRGKMVFVKDMAFTTWQAFVFYAYFKEAAAYPQAATYPQAAMYPQDATYPQVATCPQDATCPQVATYPQAATPQGQTTSCDTPQCSPKSMYRLADKYDLKDLKKLAKNNIKTKLSAYNILTELFSRFTSRYPEIFELQVQFMRENIHMKAIWLSQLPRWMGIVASGDLPHCSAVLVALCQTLASVPVPPPSTPSGAYKMCQCCGGKRRTGK
ncbi:hypothetical protein B0H21DRAFT_51460 [Amylocystis lapponica]|nr:hypothetical protein B0H21DRAFT_51460 [Amylocystis lapponica]